MRESVLDCDSLLWIKSLLVCGKKKSNFSRGEADHEITQVAHQSLGKKVDCEGVGVGEELGEWPALAEGQRANVVPRSARRDGVELVKSWCAEDVEDEGQLVVVISPREEGFPGEHFCKDTPYGPHIDSLRNQTVTCVCVCVCVRQSVRMGNSKPEKEGGSKHLGILLKGQHDFGRAVPPRGDVFSHESSFRARRLGGLDGPSETKVTNLEVAVGVEEQIGRLEVAVDDIGGVEGLECAEGLVYEVLRVVIGEVLCPDDPVHVGLHQLLDHCVPPVSERCGEQEQYWGDER